MNIKNSAINLFANMIVGKFHLCFCLLANFLTLVLKLYQTRPKYIREIYQKPSKGYRLKLVNNHIQQIVKVSLLPNLNNIQLKLLQIITNFYIFS